MNNHCESKFLLILISFTKDKSAIILAIKKTWKEKLFTIAIGKPAWIYAALISNMEWIVYFKSLMLILLALRCACNYSNNTVYYVRPTSPQYVDCPSDECQTLNDYSTNVLKQPENITVTIILIEGNHSTARDIYNFGSPNNSHTLCTLEATVKVTKQW